MNFFTGSAFVTDGSSNLATVHLDTLGKTAKKYISSFFSLLDSSTVVGKGTYITYGINSIKEIKVTQNFLEMTEDVKGRVQKNKAF